MYYKIIINHIAESKLMPYKKIAPETQLDYTAYSRHLLQLLD